MRYLLYTYLLPIIFGLGGLYLLGSCQQQPETNKKNDIRADFEPAYSLFLMYKDGTTGFLLTDSLWKQSVEIAPPYRYFSREFIQKNGLVYYVNPQNNHLVQFKLSTEGLFPLDSIRLSSDNLENFLWKNDSDTLLLFNVQKGHPDTCWYYEIDTKPLSLIRKLQVPIPGSLQDFDIISIGLSYLNKDEIWLAYTYNKMINHHSYTTIDTMYYSTFDMETFTHKELQKDSRSTYPGGINTVQPYGAQLVNGDYYFMSCPGVALGNRPSLPTAIFRRLNGNSHVDTTYMLSISDSIGNHAYGLWLVKDHEVIIRSERKDKYSDFSTHHRVFQFDYYLVDLLAGTFEKLDLPLDRGTRKENVLVRDNVVYFGLDSEGEHHYVWRYELSDGHIEHVFQSTVSTDFILRLDDLR